MDTHAKNVVIVGATSGIAKATARQLAEQHCRLLLVGRNEQKLSDLAGDLEVRGAIVKDTVVADLADFDSHAGITETALERFDKQVDIALYAHGISGDHEKAKTDYAEAERIFRVNFLSMMSLVGDMANHMEARRQGSLVAISSVAGDRGRQSNYFYGASKGALSIFLQGLRNRLQPAGVQVLNVKPGFVDTPMTADMEKGPLFAQPEAIARGIIKGIQKNRNEVYLPWFWWAIMNIIKAIPEPVFKRMKL